MATFSSYSISFWVSKQLIVAAGSFTLYIANQTTDYDSICMPYILHRIRLSTDFSLGCFFLKTITAYVPHCRCEAAALVLCSLLLLQPFVLNIDCVDITRLNNGAAQAWIPDTNNIRKAAE